MVFHVKRECSWWLSGGRDTSWFTASTRPHPDQPSDVRAGGETAERIGSAGWAMVARVALLVGMGWGPHQVWVGNPEGGVFSPSKASFSSPAPFLPVPAAASAGLGQGGTTAAPALHKPCPLMPPARPLHVLPNCPVQGSEQRGPVSPREPSSLGKSRGWESQPTPTLQLPAAAIGGVAAWRVAECDHSDCPCSPGPALRCSGFSDVLSSHASGRGLPEPRAEAASNSAN